MSIQKEPKLLALKLWVWSINQSLCNLLSQSDLDLNPCKLYWYLAHYRAVDIYVFRYECYQIWQFFFFRLFVMCNVCLELLIFSCTNNMAKMDVFDLFYKHYNQNRHTEDKLKDHQFQCVVQTKLTLTLEDEYHVKETKVFTLFSIVLYYVL